MSASESDTRTDNKDKELRMRYYQSVKNKGEFSNTFIQPPAHWLKSNLFTIAQHFGEDGSEIKKNKSWVTILSVWNTMIGSSIVSLPYLTRNAGIIPTILLNIVFCLICFYTCQVIVKTGGKDNDYSDTVHRYFGAKYGRFGRVVQIIFNLLLNVGAIFIYFLIINQNLYPNIASLLKVLGADINPSNFTPTFSHFSSMYCGIILGIVLFPLLIMKKINFLIKINSYGVYFVSILIGFVFYQGIHSMFTSKFDFEYIENKDDNETEVRHLYLFGENPSMLAGALTMGYFSHSFVLSMMQSNEKQENNKRDLFFGYCLVCLTYTSIGLLGYIGFSEIQFEAKFKDNWFLFFKPDDVFILLLRLLSVIQLCTILPIIFYVVRIQFFGTFYQDNYPSKKHVSTFCAVLIIFSLIILYFCYDLLGKMMSVIGAGTGLVLIYFIPLLVNLVYYRVKHPKGELREALMKTNLNGINELGVADVTGVSGTTGYSEIFKGPHIISKKEPSNIKDNLFYLCQALLMIFGVFNLVIQFVPINFFDIHLRKN